MPPLAEAQAVGAKMYRNFHIYTQSKINDEIVMFVHYFVNTTLTAFKLHSITNCLILCE